MVAILYELNPSHPPAQKQTGLEVAAKEIDRLIAESPELSRAANELLADVAHHAAIHQIDMPVL